MTPDQQFDRDTRVKGARLLLAILTGVFALELYLFTWAYGEEIWRLVQRLSS